MSIKQCNFSYLAGAHVKALTHNIGESFVHVKSEQWLRLAVKVILNHFEDVLLEAWVIGQMVVHLLGPWQTQI